METYVACLILFLLLSVGHGQSEGERMDIHNFQIYIRDVLQHIDIMKGRYKLPVFIIGHSMVGDILKLFPMFLHKQNV